METTTLGLKLFYDFSTEMDKFTFLNFFSAWLITTLVILLIYLCTRCCDTKSTKHRKSRPIRCLLSFFALVTTAGLAGGFWGNHVLHGGMEEFQTATQKIVEHVRHIQEMSKRYNEALQVCRITLLRSNLAFKEHFGHLKKIP